MPRRSASSARPARSGRSRSSCSPSAATTTCARSRPRARPASASRSAARRWSSRRRRREALAAGDLDLCLFSIGTSASRELVPHAVRGGAVVVDKSSAYRLADGVPLVVPEVNGARALEHEGIVANPNCCTIPLTCVLKPLHEAAGLRRVRVATYQSVSGAGREVDGAAAPASGRDEHDLRDGLGLRRRRVRRGGEAPRSRRGRSWSCPTCRSAPTCVRVPVMVGHAEAVWVETEERLSAEQARSLLGAAAERARRRRLPLARAQAAGRRATCWSAASGRTRPRRTASSSSSPATTWSRAPR